MKTKRTTALLATLVMTPAALSGCSVLGASSNETTPSDSTITIAPYSADEAAATAKAMEADAYKQGEEAFRKTVEYNPRKNEPLPDKASAFATQRWIENADEFSERAYADGRYSEGEVQIESVTPISYVQHGNPGWRMRMEFCITSSNTMFEEDGSVSEIQFQTPDGVPLKPEEDSSSIVTVDYMHSSGIWRAHAQDYETADSC